MNPDSASSRQLEVLRLIVTGWREMNPPSIRQIGEALGIRSTNGVNDHLKALEKKGLLARRGRSISLPFVPTSEGLRAARGEP